MSFGGLICTLLCSLFVDIPEHSSFQTGFNECLWMIHHALSSDDHINPDIRIKLLDHMATWSHHNMDNYPTGTMEYQWMNSGINRPALSPVNQSGNHINPAVIPIMSCIANKKPDSVSQSDKGHSVHQAVICSPVANNSAQHSPAKHTRNKQRSDKHLPIVQPTVRSLGHAEVTRSHQGQVTVLQPTVIYAQPNQIGCIRNTVVRNMRTFPYVNIHTSGRNSMWAEGHSSGDLPVGQYSGMPVFPVATVRPSPTSAFTETKPKEPPQ